MSMSCLSIIAIQYQKIIQAVRVRLWAFQRINGTWRLEHIHDLSHTSTAYSSEVVLGD